MTAAKGTFQEQLAKQIGFVDRPLNTVGIDLEAVLVNTGVPTRTNTTTTPTS